MWPSARFGDHIIHHHHSTLNLLASEGGSNYDLFYLPSFLTSEATKVLFSPAQLYKRERTKKKSGLCFCDHDSRMPCRLHEAQPSKRSIKKWQCTSGVEYNVGESSKRSLLKGLI